MRALRAIDAEVGIAHQLIDIGVRFGLVHGVIDRRDQEHGLHCVLSKGTHRFGKTDGHPGGFRDVAFPKNNLGQHHGAGAGPADGDFQVFQIGEGNKIAVLAVENPKRLVKKAAQGADVVLFPLVEPLRPALSEGHADPVAGIGEQLEILNGAAGGTEVDLQSFLFQRGFELQAEPVVAAGFRPGGDGNFARRRRRDKFVGHRKAGQHQQHRPPVRLDQLDHRTQPGFRSHRMVRDYQRLTGLT
ncbi:MAG: hypothetical protein NTW03_01760, partial [Verrucomicrobia bacterium]|nr:hypothetical protein [Verrucomicrobiota bacterium]